MASASDRRPRSGSVELTTQRRRVTLKRITLGIVLPCLIGAVLVASRAATFGSPTALLAIGPDKASYSYVHQELPNAHVFPGNGFDGMFFYTIARHPLDVRRTAEHLDVPTYRLRRILYPLMAKVVAPSGGVGTVYALVGLSLVGIAIGGWALSRFPHAPPWLPITMVINPGTICALYTSTADALAAGLTIAAFGAALRRRFTAAIIVLAIAGITRETSLIAVVALASWPGLTTRQRLAGAFGPFLPVGLWSIYLSVALGESPFDQPRGGTFTAPLLGWLREPPPAAEALLALFVFGLLVVATISGWHVFRPICLYLAVTSTLYICATPIITNQWLGFSRITTVAFPLAVWIVVARIREPGAIAKTRPSQAVTGTS